VGGLQVGTFFTFFSAVAHWTAGLRVGGRDVDLAAAAAAAKLSKQN